MPFNEEEWNIKKHHKVILVRDPFNYFASKLRHLQLKGIENVALFKSNISQLTIRWIDYAKEYLGENNYLGKRIAISYNEWFLSTSYRKKIFNQFNYGNTDGQPYTKVHEYGRGSSFNGLKKKGDKLKVLDRWRVFKNDPFFQSIFTNKHIEFGYPIGKQVIEYSQKIFGHIPGTEVLY